MIYYIGGIVWGIWNGRKDCERELLISGVLIGVF
jgi:hypothetical protein